MFINILSYKTYDDWGESAKSYYPCGAATQTTGFNNLAKRLCSLYIGLLNIKPYYGTIILVVII